VRRLVELTEKLIKTALVGSADPSQHCGNPSPGSAVGKAENSNAYLTGFIDSGFNLLLGCSRESQPDS
jgi:hypothetical protein